ncbi:MAG: TRAP transporter large permease [Rhizobacter sp.]|nr:TRAP transporter large permease [Rhizobacter sp.]
MSLALTVVPFALLVLGFPIYAVLLAASCAALVLSPDLQLLALHQNLFAGVNSLALLAIPFFIYAGELMGRGSLAGRLIDVVDAAARPVPGNLALTTVGSATLFGAISGASAATVATIGRIMHPTLLRAGYPPTFAAGLVTTVGAIDIVIPPSIPMIVYAIAANESVPRLYAAGVLPGLLLAALLAVYVVVAARRSGVGKGRPFDAASLWHAASRATWALGAPVIVLGGIYGGWVSPTEAAALGCAYAALVTRLVYRELSARDVFEAASSTIRFCGQVLIIAACANVFGWLLTVQQVPVAVVSWVSQWELSPWALLLAINILLLVVGCLLDPISAILMLAPLLVPVAQSAGIDTLHLGIVMTVNLAIGLFTPPFGVNLFVAQSTLGLQLPLLYRSILPFLGVYLIGLAIVTYVPSLSLLGPQLLLALPD